MSDPMTLRIVMKFLKEHNYSESLITLQRQSETNYISYPKQIQFLRKIILKGDFQEAVQFLSTIQSRLDYKQYKALCLQLYKQKLYELIDCPIESELKNLFQKEIVHYCTQQEYQNLFTLLTCRSTKQINGLSNWSSIKGRLACFQLIFPHVQNILYKHKKQDTNQPELNLDQIIATYLQKSSGQIMKNKMSPSSALHKQNTNKNNFYKIKGESQFNQQYQNDQQSKESAQKKITEQDDVKELQLSESQYQQSQAFDKRPRFYANLSKDRNESRNIQNQSNLNKNNVKISNIHIKPDNYYQSQQINQISQEQQHSDTVKSYQNINRSRTQTQKEQFQQFNEDDKIEVENTSSVVYKNQDQNFTFSQNNYINESSLVKNKKIIKLAVIQDNKAIRTCQFSESGSFFAVGTNSSYIKIFDVQELFSSKKLLNISPIYQIDNIHTKSIFCLNWSKNERSMATCSNDLTIRITDFNQDFSNHKSNIIGRHQSCIRMVKLNQQQNKVISCGDDSLIKVWDLGKIKKCYNLKGHTSGVSAFKLLQNSNRSQLYSVGKDSTIRKWDLRTLNCVTTSKPQDSQMTYIASNTNRIAVSHKDGNVSFFSNNLQLQYTVRIHEEEIRSIEALQKKDLFLTASFDGHVSLFSQKTAHSPDYFQHNQNSEDKVVFATFLNNPNINGFASTSTLGLCHIYTYL